jgi:hypothetical protein
MKGWIHPGSQIRNWLACSRTSGGAQGNGRLIVAKGSRI